jgi:hypothetical protein
MTPTPARHQDGGPAATGPGRGRPWARLANPEAGWPPPGALVLRALQSSCALQRRHVVRAGSTRLRPVRYRRRAGGTTPWLGACRQFLRQSYFPTSQTFWAISELQLSCMAFIPAAGVLDPLRICCQAVLISVSTAPALGTPTIMVE